MDSGMDHSVCATAGLWEPSATEGSVLTETGMEQDAYVTRGSKESAVIPPRWLHLFVATGFFKAAGAFVMKDGQGAFVTRVSQVKSPF